MFNFSVLANDRIAASLEHKIDICSELMLTHMEIDDRIGGKSLTIMNGEELEEMRNRLIMKQKRIVLVNGTEPGTDFEYYRKLFAKAFLLHADNVKVKTNGPGTYAEDIIAGIAKLRPVAKSYGIGLLIENDAQSAFSDDPGMTALFKQIRTEQTGLIFNPLEFARQRAHPFFHVFYNSKLKGDVRFLRVNDGLFADGAPALPGEGNAELKELASILLSRSYRGYFSFTPYLPNNDISRLGLMLDRFKTMLMTL
ncbi:hypothetical protein [Paenibacillus sp. MBLB4367]|uniref:hypothetical protein n=1 Tax=Paenibacillus sp. MBLB4367 TaxID=3384767 RepID=UPI003908347F